MPDGGFHVSHYRPRLCVRGLFSPAYISLDNESHGVTFLFIWHLLVGVIRLSYNLHSTVGLSGVSYGSSCLRTVFSLVY